MIKVVGNTPALPVEMEVVTPPPDEQRAALARREQYDKNRLWFEAHVKEIAEQHAGEYICVANETLFAGTDPVEVFARARAAFPEDFGAFFTTHVRRS